eukprot:CAMPEP_0197448532 /NCGR_PEP_ID=MMETSP1175-20131217/17920_1 /TAXON_ID=1003142 /ORGANISM="Triceratium dubium, Strain CCMP147" /LENGTH=31 /DNA_ID= /DNA_START= /DNA_END= /DNA_ORIENTATION=
MREGDTGPAAAPHSVPSGRLGAAAKLRPLGL